MIKPTQVREGLIQAITEIQTLSGRPVPVITDATRPVGDLSGFDSVNCVEVSFLLSEYFGQEIESDLIVTDRNGRPRSVAEMVGLVCDYLCGGSGNEL